MFAHYYRRLDRERAILHVQQDYEGSVFTITSEAQHAAHANLDQLIQRWTQARLIRLRADWSNGNGQIIREYEFHKPLVKMIVVGPGWWSAHFTDPSRRFEHYPLAASTGHLFNAWARGHAPPNVQSSVRVTDTGPVLFFAFLDRYAWFDPATDQGDPE